jgi:hypothetical protein
MVNNNPRPTGNNNNEYDRYWLKMVEPLSRNKFSSRKNYINALVKAWKSMNYNNNKNFLIQHLYNNNRGALLGLMSRLPNNITRNYLNNLLTYRRRGPQNTQWTTVRPTTFLKKPRHVREIRNGAYIYNDLLTTAKRLTNSSHKRKLIHRNDMIRFMNTFPHKNPVNAANKLMNIRRKIATRTIARHRKTAPIAIYMEGLRKVRQLNKNRSR